MKTKSELIKLWLKFLTFIIILFYIIYYKYKNNSYTTIKFCQKIPAISTTKSLKVKEVLKSELTNLTTFLFWTDWYSSRNIESIINDKTFALCPEKCHVTFDKSLLYQSDGIIFHERDMTKNFPSRLENQVWIFMSMESPSYSYTFRHLGSYPGIFNWTMTYRRDSDIYFPSGRVIQRDQTTDPFNYNELSKSLKNRKLAAWIVSHCPTVGKREKLVRQLSKFIPIDVYGKCGNHKCSEKGENSIRDCYSEIAKFYKFYLSFENSLCIDYVTEKFFYALEFNIVPIVFGGANYSLFAPERSFINARDFSSPKELSQYLLHLNTHNEEYLEYFDWKKEWKAMNNPLDSLNPWCLLCGKTNEMKRQIRRFNEMKQNFYKMSERFPKSIYKDLNLWWNNKPSSSNKACSYALASR